MISLSSTLLLLCWMMTKQWKLIWKKQYSLAGLTAADQFKSYEDLERRLKYVLGQKSRPTTPVDEETEYDGYAAKESAERQIQESLSRSKPDFNSPDITASAPAILSPMKTKMMHSLTSRNWQRVN